jgi:hypothetical protein
MSKGVAMEPKHSGLGIASFIISIIVGILIFLLVVIAGIMETTTSGGINENSAGALILGATIFALIALDVVGLGLGIAGCSQKNKKKIFAILGTIFAAATALGTIVMIIIGSLIP